MKVPVGPWPPRVLYTAADGSEAADKLDFLRVTAVNAVTAAASTPAGSS